MNAPDSKSGRILVIDDDQDLAESVVEVLEDDGYTVEMALDADSAIEAARNFDAQIALIDIRLGQSSGLKLIEPLKSARPTVMPIMMTGNSDREAAISAIRLGAYDFLTKPVQFGDLFAALDRCFDHLQLQADKEQALREMEIAKEEAQAANRAKSEFLASVSHELRTPLNAIIGLSDVIQSQGSANLPDGKVEEFAGDINAAGQQLFGVVNDVLNIATIEAGRMTLEESDFDLCYVIEAVCRSFATESDAKDLTIETGMPSESFYILGDARKFRLVLEKLIGNAIKFTETGGRIEVSFEIDQHESLCLSIKDNGIGIREEDIPKALAAFVQVDGSLSREFEGTGLGLPIASAITELHGGRLELKSEVEVGTTVLVRLPQNRIANQVDTETAESKLAS